MICCYLFLNSFDDLYLFSSSAEGWVLAGRSCHFDGVDFLRIQYNKRYKQRLNLFQRIKQEWGAWNKNQRLTSIILTVIALIIFGCLFPLNSFTGE